jgi:hydroxypyruvate isomerase
LSGLKLAQYGYEEHWQVLVENVKYAAQELARHNMTLMIEAINSRVDMPGFLLDTLEKTQRLIQEVNEANVKIQFDIYHMQIMHGDITRKLTSLKDDIGHIQFADNPGRHEPGTGELNFPYIFNTLDKLGYTGYVSAEYIPSTSTNESLLWLTERCC